MLYRKSAPFLRISTLTTNMFNRYVFNGIVALYTATTVGRSSSIWNEAVKLLEGKQIQKSFYAVVPLTSINRH